VNKIDKENVDLKKTVQEIKNLLSKRAILLNSDNPDELTELVAESDDALIEKYLSTGKLSSEEIQSGLRKAVASVKVFPYHLWFSG